MDKPDKFMRENRKEVERIAAWVNGFMAKGDLEGLQNAAITLQGIVGIIGQYLVDRAAQELEEQGIDGKPRLIQ
ncbi:MAG TPA: hypothetical protein PLR20_05760 [Syntrophales bacterium]|nr:hypothetical protein [Syntrophales bacterium]HOX94495.1 hypothetical protein [Syntrophales bacterium]HPI57878.1 hypothetical protein [Syntrophales bacterium]HPN24536.1 hypothetical protein [Syntrophales bacterium]HQM28842.1 hypothetical protein [Syntrophales bacterium]